MFPLFETISIRNGKAENLPWHQDRLEATHRALYGKDPDFNLAEVIRVPYDSQHGHFRCRIDYEKEILKIDFQPYLAREIHTLRMVFDNELEYPYKYSDRQRLEGLFEMRGANDDVLIVKHGFITDTSIANIIFWDGRRWITPANPLLPGTCRARLLDLGIIHEKRIHATDLYNFKEFKIINALRNLDDSQPIPIHNISQ